jgi:hypothetical protein
VKSQAPAAPRPQVRPGSEERRSEQRGLSPPGDKAPFQRDQWCPGPGGQESGDVHVRRRGWQTTKVVKREKALTSRAAAGATFAAEGVRAKLSDGNGLVAFSASTVGRPREVSSGRHLLLPRVPAHLAQSYSQAVPASLGLVPDGHGRQQKAPAGVMPPGHSWDPRFGHSAVPDKHVPPADSHFSFPQPEYTVTPSIKSTASTFIDILLQMRDEDLFQF